MYKYTAFLQPVRGRCYDKGTRNDLQPQQVLRRKFTNVKSTNNNRWRLAMEQACRQGDAIVPQSSGMLTASRFFDGVQGHRGKVRDSFLH